MLVSVLENNYCKTSDQQGSQVHILHTRKRKASTSGHRAPDTWVSESDSSGEIPPAANVLHHFAILSWLVTGPRSENRAGSGGVKESRLLQLCSE